MAPIFSLRGEMDDLERKEMSAKIRSYEEVLAFTCCGAWSDEEILEIECKDCQEIALIAKATLKEFA